MKYLWLICFALTFTAPLSANNGLTLKLFLDICKVDTNSCQMMFYATEDAAQYGALFNEIHRGNVDKKSQNLYFCWNAAAKTTAGQKLQEFTRFLETSNFEENLPFSAAVAIYLKEQYPSCST